ncbi:hypothetical protein [Mucilaginibacter xinganensis]|uniref:DUF4382 domain-containing protein n=1 Tax=Mucilaginibacter xinganensis TaxID=1234841 RepID=A0A223P2G1_9SPHI|nr:hypothetical protein [Mucilaginibacter xinganensis]ASU36295.1 hypothetical protein MuYL_4410 [Mucilaginibacter xinganensis]
MKTLKTNTIKLATALLILSTALVSCKKDTGVKPAAGSQISFGIKAGSSLTPLSASGLQTAAVAPVISWTQGTANIAEFKFEAKMGGIKKEVKAKGLTNVNLFDLSPSFVNTTIDTGLFSEIEVKVEFVKSTTGAAIPLVLKGSFTKPDGTVVPVELDVNDNFEIKAEAKNVFIDKTTNLKTTLILRLNELLQGVTPAELAAATQTSGTIVISSSSNAALLNKIILNLQNIGGTEFEGEHEHKGGDDNGQNQGGESHGSDG